jgi:hypothetical protein
MPRKNEFVVTVSKAGYVSSQTQIRSKLADSGTTAFLGNALVGGVVGATLDATNGSMNDLKPNPLHVDLQPIATVQPPPAAQAPPPAPAPASQSPTSPAPSQGATPAPAQ